MKWITKLFARPDTGARSMSAKEVEQWIYKSDPSWEACGVLTTRHALRILPLIFSGEPRLGFGKWYQNMVGSTFRCLAIAHFASRSEKNIVLGLSDKALREWGSNKTEEHATLRRKMDEFALSEARRIHGKQTKSNIYEFSESRREALWFYDPHGVIFSATMYHLSFALNCFAHSKGDGGRKYTGKSNSHVLLRDLQGNIEKQIERSLQALAKTETKLNINHKLVTSAIYSELTSEIESIRSDKLEPQEINQLPLWRGKMPSLISSCWQNNSCGLIESDRWQVWFEWFEQRLRGGAPDANREKIYARIPIELWTLPPREMNEFLISRLKSKPLPTMPE